MERDTTVLETGTADYEVMMIMMIKLSHSTPWRLLSGQEV
jgi:hypothetical protein